MAGLAPHVRARLKDMYLRGGNRAAADAQLESEMRIATARERVVRAPAVPPVLPGGISVTEPPYAVGCFHCGQRHKCDTPRLCTWAIRGQ